MKKLFNLFMVLLVSAAICSCDSSDEPSPGTRPHIDLKLTPQETSLAANMDVFPVDLLISAYEMENSENIMVSPISASMVIGMLTNAIDPEDRGEILQSLNLKNSDLTTFDSFLHKLMASLPGIDPNSKFTIDNGFWHKTDVALSDYYESLLTDNYYAQLGKFSDFNISTINEINSWISNMTNGGIDRLLNDNDANPDINTVWVDALYFKGSWTQKFNKESTRPMPFYPNYPDKTVSKNVEMMCESSFRYQYFHFPADAPKYGYGYDYDDAVTAVMLPYGNESFIFTAILPSINRPDMESTLSELTPDFWKAIDNICSVEKREPGDVAIFLPKLKLEKTTDFVPVLKNMGVANLFDKVSMDENLGLPEQSISIFRQSAVFDLDEEGSEIKVATVASGMVSAPGPPEFIEFNRPFLFFVRERTTGAVLLEGIVMNP